MSLTIGDVHVPGGITRSRRKRHVLFTKASFMGGSQPLSQAEHQQRVNAARRSAEVRRRLGGMAGKGGRGALIAAISAGAIGSLAAPVRERRAPGVTESQERVSRVAGYVGAGIGGLAGGLAGGGLGSIALGLAGATAGQELFERGTLALFGRNRGDMARRFSEGNRLDTPGAALGGGLGAAGGFAASYLLNRTTPGKVLRGARDVFMPVAGSALGSEVGRNFEGRGARLFETAGGAGSLAALSLLGRRVPAIRGRRPDYKPFPPVLSNRSLLRYARLSKSNITEAEREQRRNAARARWARHVPDNAQDVEDRPASRRARDTAISVGIGAAALGAGLTLIGLLSRGRGPKGGKAIRLLEARAVRSQAKATVGRMTDINRRIGHIETRLSTALSKPSGIPTRVSTSSEKTKEQLLRDIAGIKESVAAGKGNQYSQELLGSARRKLWGEMKAKSVKISNELVIGTPEYKKLQTRLVRLTGERSNLEGQAGRARELLSTTFRAKLTTPGLKRTANNARGRFTKFNTQLSAEEIEQRRAAGRASAAARRARAHATEVIEPSVKVNEVISPSFFTRDNLITGAIGGAALGGLFALSRGRIKAREAARTSEMSVTALRRVMPQTVEEMRAGIRGSERLASDAGLFRLIARGVSQDGDDLAAAGERAQRAIRLADEARRRAGNNIVNLPEGMKSAPRSPGSGNLLAGQSTGSLGGDADMASRLRQVAGWASTAIGRERGARLSQGPGKALSGPGQPGITTPGLNRLADAADNAGNRLAAGVEGSRLTLKPLHSKRVASVGQPNLELRRLNTTDFIEPSKQRIQLGVNRRDRLAAQAVQDITDVEAEALLAARAETLRWVRNKRKLDAMRGTTALSEWGAPKGSGQIRQTRSSLFAPKERTIGGSFRGSNADSSLYISPTPARQMQFGGALSDPTSPFRRGRFTRS